MDTAVSVSQGCAHHTQSSRAADGDDVSHGWGVGPRALSSESESTWRSGRCQGISGGGCSRPKLSDAAASKPGRWQARSRPAAPAIAVGARRATGRPGTPQGRGTRTPFANWPCELRHSPRELARGTALTAAGSGTGRGLAHRGERSRWRTWTNTLPPGSRGDGRSTAPMDSRVGSSRACGGIACAGDVRAAPPGGGGRRLPAGPPTTAAQARAETSLSRHHPVTDACGQQTRPRRSDGNLVSARGDLQGAPGGRLRVL
jgi:hypothetical protein